MKYFWVLEFWTFFSAVYLSLIAVFIFLFHQGTLGILFIVVDLPIIKFAILIIELVNASAKVLIFVVKVSFIFLISSSNSLLSKS